MVLTLALLRVDKVAAARTGADPEWSYLPIVNLSFLRGSSYSRQYTVAPLYKVSFNSDEA
jgi:hypothetical protein